MESIYAWQDHLKRRSLLVLFLSYLYLTALLTLFFLVLYPSPEMIIPATLISLLLAGLLSVFQFWYVYNNPQHVVAGITGAEPARDPRLLNVVEKMEIAYGIEGVKTYVVPWNVINAFVVSSPEGKYLFVTEGALMKLNDRELEAMLAHEFAHFAHNDAKYMTFAVVVAGITVLLAYYMLRVLPRMGNERRRSSVYVLALLAAIVLAALAPLVQRILVSAISKSREFLADAKAVEVTKYPPAMISLLLKVGSESTLKEIEHKHIPKTFGALFFDFEDIETHPPIEERIKKIAELTGIDYRRYFTTNASPNR